MSYFKESTSKATIKVLEVCVPEILINPNALVKMQLFVDGCTEEVGWLGTAYQRDKSIYIDDVFLFEQEVHSTTTEITPDGLGKFGEAILQQQDGMEIWNNLKVWGHSHVNMSTFASGQDDKQMETFAESGHNWFIRIIANKKGEFRVDLYNYELGIIYNDMPWEEIISKEEEQIEVQINNLYHALDLIKKTRVERYAEGVKEEIKDKVKKKYYNQYNQHSSVHQIGTSGTITTINPQEVDKKKVVDIKDVKAGKEIIVKGNDYNYNDMIESPTSVYEYFDAETMLDIGACENYKELDDVLAESGYLSFFSHQDKMIIWKEGQRTWNYYYTTGRV